MNEEKPIWAEHMRKHASTNTVSDVYLDGLTIGSSIESDLNILLGDIVDHVGGDGYDHSLEIYIVHEDYTKFTFPQAAIELIKSWGFSRFWANYSGYGSETKLAEDYASTITEWKVSRKIVEGCS